MFIYIDTTNDIPKLSLLDEELQPKSTKELGDKNYLAEKILLLVDNLLAQQQLSKSGLRGVLVNPGPGSYTGLRLGVSTANLIGFALNIPVISYSGYEKLEDLVVSSKFVNPVKAIYANPPHITKSKHGL